MDWPSDFSGPALDPATLERLDRLSPGGSFVAQLARRFLADADTHLCALRTALAEGDIALLSFSAHTLTGSSASVGAAELCRLCSLLSTPQAPTDWSRVASVLAAMDLELERARAAFDAWVSGR